jgi:hypothetical protein
MATAQAQQTIDARHSIQWRNEVAPRVLFEMMRYKPSAKVPQFTMTVSRFHLQPTPYSLCYAAASGRGSCPAFGRSDSRTYWCMEGLQNSMQRMRTPCAIPN